MEQAKAAPRDIGGEHFALLRLLAALLAWGQDAKGKTLTLMNTADGTKYALRFVGLK